MRETDLKKSETIKILLNTGAVRHSKDCFSLKPISGGETKGSQDRFLEPTGEPNGGDLPYMFAYNCNDRLIPVMRDKLLRYVEIDD